MEGKYADVDESKTVDKMTKGFEGITVVENENRRKDAISHFPKEVAQVAKDIAAFFKVSNQEEDGKRAKVIDRLPGPQALKILLEHVEESADDERAVWFLEYKLLSAKEIKNLGVMEPCGLVPFAVNIDEDMLATGEDEHSGGVFCISADGEIESDEEATCMATYLESYRDTLLSNRLEFIEDCGMVERAPQSPPATMSKK